jgi:hypothetical protein
MGIVAIQLDISRAFYTVPHEAIEDAFRRKMIPKHVTTFIRTLYEGIKTVIKQGSREVPIQIKRGVKQGNPLSPLLFNSVLEPLILKLESQQGFETNNECIISSLAVADDILLAPDVPQAKKTLETTERYLQDLGTKISAPKCAVFKICTTKDTWYLMDPLLTTMNGYKIPNVIADTTISWW